jgi:simple sugar transport system permease protein
VVAVACGLLAGGVVMALGGHDPIQAYFDMWQGSLGSTEGLQSTLIKATPLVLTGLAVATALRVGLWNIGGEGQLIMGAIAATGVGLYATGLPGALLLIAMILAGAAGGAVWAAIAVIPGTGVHIGLALAILAALATWWLIERTPWGFSVRVSGGNPRTAEYLGLKIARRMVVVLAISGAIAGLAGAIELTGVTNRLQEGISVNYGYTGVLIAFLARGRLLAVVLAAFLFATLVVGSYALQTTGVAQPIATIIQALIIVFLLAGDAALAFRLRITRTTALAEIAAAVSRP